MKEKSSEKKQPYMTPDTLCWAFSTETAVLTVSGNIDEEPWGD